MDLLKILPMAFVMVAGPQIISSFFFATSENWKMISAAYVAGAALSIPIVTAAAYLFAKGVGGGGGKGGESGLSTIDYVVVGLLIYAAIRTYLKRGESEPPKWMGKLQGATPKMTFILGFLLLGIFPSDLVTSVSVGSYLANHGDRWLEVLPFIAFTLLLLGLPALLVLALGERAQTLLPKVRNWMNDNSWLISEIVLVLFIAIILSG